MSLRGRTASNSHNPLHGRLVTDATVESQYMYHHSNYYGGGLEDVRSLRSLLSSFCKAILATAVFRCWHILIFFLAWATAVSVMNTRGIHLVIQPTLLTVVGTVIGFVISYRTTASFERYNEGRRYWSQIILTSRTFARAIWFHVPESTVTSENDRTGFERSSARILVEKKTIINLIEAFSVSVKHYLRGEDGIAYEDLYHFVKFLPSYKSNIGDDSLRENTESNTGAGHATSRTRLTDVHCEDVTHIETEFNLKGLEQTHSTSTAKRAERTIRHRNDTDLALKPASMPPTIFARGFSPFLFGYGKGPRDRRSRKDLNPFLANENVPLEVITYLSIYVAAVQRRKILDVPTTNLLLTSINLFQDALAGLERIITTPIPFSYSMHLWLVTIVYCLALPLQIWPTLKFLTIPATGVVVFVLFGFLVAGEEIENPFGYELNDLNMDHFTHIIRTEIDSLTTCAPSLDIDWVFSPENDHVLPSTRSKTRSNLDERGR